MDNYLVFDLETQRSAQDVGGWQNIAEMKVSVGVIWDSQKDQFFTYYEDQVMGLITHLKSGPLIIGYNHIGFDYTVLTGYYPPGKEREQALKEFSSLPNLDLLIEIRQILGKRIKLDSIARATLNAGKSADGLLALQWYKDYLNGEEDKLKKIADYCRMDVEVTRDIYLYGCAKREVLYIDKVLGLKKIEVNWGKSQVVPKSPGTFQLSF